MLPTWAIPSAAVKLVLESFRHPNTDKAIVVDEDQRSVEVLPAIEADMSGSRHRPTVSTS